MTDVVKEYIDPVKVQHALRVAHGIKAKNKPFNISRWTEAEEDENSCGTSACLMGWMGRDKQCRALGLTCDYAGPVFNGHRRLAEYTFWLKPEFVDDVIRMEVRYAISDIIYEDRYIVDDDDVIIDLVIERLEALLVRVS